MKIVGINTGVTKNGMRLNDGGACLIDEKGIICIAEERITRKKHDSGFEKSLKYCLDARGYNIDDIDYFIASTCCERPLHNFDDIGFGIPGHKTIAVPTHHYSHACSAYFSSPFSEAIVMVSDNEGNIIQDLGKENFYENILEHMSYYIGIDNELKLIERDTVLPEQISVGDAYRYFTHYIGFPSYVYAGKTMGLAPYGNTERYENVRIFELVDGKIECLIKSDYFNCEKALQNFFFENYNITLPKPRKVIDEITQEYADLAFLIQKETERILVEKIVYLVKKTGVKNLCIAGGVGLNSVANEKLLKKVPLDNIYIVPAAGDSGQCFGNALYGLHHIFKKKERMSINNAYLGKVYSDDEIEFSINEFRKQINEKFIFEKFNDYSSLNEVVASKLFNGKIVARFDGGSEFGPRALGNRSILMDPRKAENKDILNKRVKFREAFRPFAPTVLLEHSKNYFELDRESPFMLLVAEVNKPLDIPAVTHVDGTARVQTLSKSQNANYYSLIEKFFELSGTPVLLNTSFNIDGEPIVETPKDALNCFFSTEIDCLCIGNWFVEKLN